MEVDFNQEHNIIYIENENHDNEVFSMVRNVISNSVQVASNNQRSICFVQADVNEEDKNYFSEDTIQFIQKYKVILSPALNTKKIKLNDYLVQKFHLDLLYFHIHSFYKFPTFFKIDKKINIEVFGFHQQFYDFKEFNDTKTIISKKENNLFESIQFVLDYAIKNRLRSITLLQKNNNLADVFFHTAKEYFPNQFITFEECGGNTPKDKILIQDEKIDTFFSKFIFNTDKYNLLLVEQNYSFLVENMISALTNTSEINFFSMRGSSSQISIFQSPHIVSSNLIGHDKANPIDFLLAGVSMLKHIHEKEASLLLMNAVEEMFIEKRLPFDIARNIDEAIGIESSQYLNEIMEKIKL